MTHLNLLRSKGWLSAEGEEGAERHGSVPVPASASFWRKLLAFSGPGYLVAVGYMDPGNWATDLAGGSEFGYALLFVVLLSSVAAMLLQYLSAKLGLATGRDLAETCRDTLPRPATFFFWLMAEVMIIACDLAEVIGSAIALELLFGIPLALGVCVTALDVLLLFVLQRRGLRVLEAFVVVLIMTIAACLFIDVFLSHPAFGLAFNGLLPSTALFRNSGMLYIAVGIVGATVMPHNLYLHSALAQTRRYAEDSAGKREAIRYSGIDSTCALALAFVVNAAILILSAAAFGAHGLTNVGDIREAYRLLVPILGTTLAAILFAVGLLASGQNATLTGTMAGQIIAEGFLGLRFAPWVRRLLTRGFAIVPALIVVVYFGDAALSRLLVLSQVVLSVELPFAMIPLVLFTGSKKRMGEFVDAPVTRVVAGAVALGITALNVWLVWSIV